MALEYGPFNGLENAWDAYDFAEYFKLFYGNGVFPNPSNNLQVVTNANMQTKVSVGVGFVEGHKIKNTSDFILQHDIADGVLKRIDRVVMRANSLQNKGEIIVKKGTPASSPVAPTLVRNTDYYELALADVLINNGATVITQANITDQRLNTALCGIVATNITQLDTTTLALQYQAAFEQMTIEQQQEFEAWIATLEDILDENVAATLANRLLTVEGDVSDIDTQLTQHSAQITTLQNNNQKATQAEAIAGTNNTKVMTPLLTKYANTVAVNGDSENLDNTTIPFLIKQIDGMYYYVETKFFNQFGGAQAIQTRYSYFGQPDIGVRHKYENVWSDWSPSIQGLFQSVSNGKAQIAAAITGKGVNTAADSTFATLTNNINQINVGPRTASGTVTSTGPQLFTLQNGNTQNGLGLVTVSGLGFTPSKINIYLDSGTFNFYETNYNSTYNYPFNGAMTSEYGTGPDTGTTYNINPQESPCYINNGGFALPVQLVGQNYSWYAEGY